MSVVALSVTALRDRGIESTEDLERIVPGLTFTPTPSGPPVLTLRGVGFYDSTLAATPAVSVYVDEAPLALPSFSQVGVIDIERLEVLKGPQGTLYGENSTGGAINYIAAKPTPDLGAGASLSLGRFATVQGEGFVSGPLTDTLAFRVAAKTSQGDDWQRSYTRAAELGEIHRTAARALLHWNPNSNVAMVLNLNGWADSSDTQAFQLQAVECALPANCAPELIDYPSAPADARVADWTAGWPKSDDRFRQATLRTDIQLSRTLRLTSIGGYQDFEQDKFIDQDATRTSNLQFRQQGAAHSFNQEIRLAADAGALTWLAGGYGSWTTVQEDISVWNTLASVNQPLPALFPPATTAVAAFEHVSRSHAAFGSLEYALSRNWNVLAGVRYTRSMLQFAGCEKSGSDPTLGQLFAFLGAAARGMLPQIDPIPANGCISLDSVTLRQGMTRNRLAEENWSFRAGLNYKTAHDALVYGTVSQGYKSGSFPSLSATTSAQFMPVTQESVLAYEAGVKMSLLDRAVQFELGAYYYDYDDKQIRGRIADPVFGALEALVNIPHSRLFGFESGIRVAPAENLQLGASVSYTDSKVGHFIGITPMSTTRDFSGSTFPYSPQWQSTLDAQYERTVGAGYRAFFGAGAMHHSTAYAVLGEDPDFRLDPYTTVDVRAGVRAADDRWQVSVFGLNVTDEYSWSNVFQFIDTRFRIAARPATYGVRVAVNY
jgi:outer membrane receptor protein involved in Fe transport